MLDSDILSFASAPTSDFIQGHLDKMKELIGKLLALEIADNKFVMEGIEELVRRANRVDVPKNDQNSDAFDPKEDVIDKEKFLLARFARQRAPIDLTFISLCLLSDEGEEDLKEANPYIEEPSSLLTLMAGVMLRSSRVSQINRCLSAAYSVRALLRQLLQVVEESAVAASPSVAADPSTPTVTPTPSSDPSKRKEKRSRDKKKTDLSKGKEKEKPTERTRRGGKSKKERVTLDMSWKKSPQKSLNFDGSKVFLWPGFTNTDLVRLARTYWSDLSSCPQTWPKFLVARDTTSKKVFACLL
jgi:hypothetical protein